MRARSAEYKEAVNRVAWDGNWYTYAFFEDGEPIGSASNLEGKIHVNVQTWAIFSGIIDDPDKVRRIEKAMNRYLQTPFGPMLYYPPYVFHGERCGRLQRQRPGTYANGAIYNHSSGFKVYSDVARGDYDDALDTFQRAIPNHPDNSDMCRIGEPYAVGNVYFGINHPRMGMNLFTWWTATPAWLMHGGFEQILGVKAEYNGLMIEPHVPIDWNAYSVEKLYRGTRYRIRFERTDGETGIWLDGVKQAGNCIKSEKDACEVLVKF
jgi:cellobiose phosphorylase